MMYGLISDNDDLDKFSDQEIFAKTLYGEARGEPDEGKQAVANVVMNRVAHKGWWGHDVRSCCLRPYQFSCWLESDPNRPKIVAVTTAEPVYTKCLDIAGLAMYGHLPDITDGSDSYLRVGTDAPWVRTLQPVKIIGHHAFYKTI